MSSCVDLIECYGYGRIIATTAQSATSSICRSSCCGSNTRRSWILLHHARFIALVGVLLFVANRKMLSKKKRDAKKAKNETKGGNVFPNTNSGRAFICKLLLLVFLRCVYLYGRPKLLAIVITMMMTMMGMEMTRHTKQPGRQAIMCPCP